MTLRITVVAGLGKSIISTLAPYGITPQLYENKVVSSESGARLFDIVECEGTAEIIDTVQRLVLKAPYYRPSAVIFLDATNLPRIS